LADAYFFSAVRVRGDSDRGEKAPRAEGEEAVVNLKTLITTEDKRKKALASAMAAAVLAAGLITTTEAKPIHAVFTGQNGRIAFTSNAAIRVHLADGTKKKTITSENSGDSDWGVVT
jgi:hypothetical protein